MKGSRKTLSVYIRNIIFGVEDSLVSTVGLLAGITVSEVPRNTVILTGVIYILVEAFSMAVGSFMSEEFAEEYAEGRKAPLGLSIAGSVIMFFSFFLAGFIPLIPYIFMSNGHALATSIIGSLIALFLTGYVNSLHSHVKKVNSFKRGIFIAVLGGAAIAIGVIVGRFFKV